MDQRRPTLILVYWGIRGGGARYTFELARALADRGAVRVVVSLNSACEILANFTELAEAGGITLDVRRFSTGARANATASLIPGRLSFGSWCKAHGDHVTITMGNPLSLPVALTLRAARMPFTHVIHDADRHPGERSVAMHFSVRQAARLAEHVVALSHTVRDRIVSEWRVDPKKVSVIAHGPFYAAEAQLRREAGNSSAAIESTRKLVLFIGRILPYKGLDLLLSAWAEVAADYPDVKLIIAGEGDLGTSHNAIENLGVEVTNRWLSEAEIIERISSASLLVLPYTEASQSGVIGIAHAFGVRVLCTRVGGLADQAQDQDLVVEPTAEAIAHGLRSLLRVSAPAAKFVQGPTWDDIARRFQMSPVGPLGVG